MTRLEKARDNLIGELWMLPRPVEAADAVIAVVEAMVKKPRRRRRKR